MDPLAESGSIELVLQRGATIRHPGEVGVTGVLQDQRVAGQCNRQLMFMVANMKVPAVRVERQAQVAALQGGQIVIAQNRQQHPAAQ